MDILGPVGVPDNGCLGRHPTIVKNIKSLTIGCLDIWTLIDTEPVQYDLNGD